MITENGEEHRHRGDQVVAIVDVGGELDELFFAGAALVLGVELALGQGEQGLGLLAGDHRALAPLQALDVEDQVVGGLIAVLAILGHHRLDDHAQSAGKPGIEMVGRDDGHVGVDVLAHHLVGGFAAVGNLAGDHVVKGRPQAVDIGPDVDIGLTAHLLGADVIRRADRHAGLGQHPFIVVGQARQTEIGQLDFALFRQDHVFGLDVAVDQTRAGPRVSRPRRSPA